MPDDATGMKARLRSDLREAMRRGSRHEVALLRELIAAIDNAEATPATAAPAPLLHHDFGSGSAEVPRRHLEEEAVRTLLRREIAERERAAAAFEGLGDGERAKVLRADALIARRYLEA